MGSGFQCADNTGERDVSGRCWGGTSKLVEGGKEAAACFSFCGDKNG